MTAPAAEPREQPPSDEQALLGALALVLVTPAPATATIAAALPLLAAFGIAPAVGLDLLSLAVSRFGRLLPEAAAHEPPGPAASWNAGTEITRRAEYLVEAARRLADPEHSIERERQHLARHLAAQDRRAEAAERVDEVTGRVGGVVGWYALLDARTTPECRAAHGTNFNAAKPPVIGYPGTPHGGTCRCRPGPPHRGGRATDEAIAEIVSRGKFPPHD